MTDMLDLLRSTIDLHERFGVVRPTLKTVNALVKEEYKEFCDARDAGLKYDAAEEAVDLFVVVLATLWTLDVPQPAIDDAMRKVIAKNAAKIPGVTHGVNEFTGKITRKST